MEWAVVCVRQERTHLTLSHQSSCRDSLISKDTVNRGEFAGLMLLSDGIQGKAKLVRRPPMPLPLPELPSSVKRLLGAQLEVQEE